MFILDSSSSTSTGSSLASPTLAERKGHRYPSYTLQPTAVDKPLLLPIPWTIHVSNVLSMHSRIIKTRVDRKRASQCIARSALRV